MNKAVFSAAVHALELKFPDLEGKLKSYAPIAGGSINQCFKVYGNGATFFVKYNEYTAFPGMIESERKSLDVLASCSAINIPEVLHLGYADTSVFLIEAFIETVKATPDFSRQLGTQLAKLHRFSMPWFGFTEDNYIGTLPQSNKQCDNWAEFFITQRIEKQLSILPASLGIESGFIKRISHVLNKIESYFPTEPAALLHGDLWSGNVLCGQNQAPFLIDPATYFGHREMDIAMMHLFGGFEKAAFVAYNEEFPLEKKWEERIDLCNLYPLLVHVNLFGGSYLSQIHAILNKYSW